MSKITSIGTSVPPYRHEQQQVVQFMQRVHAGGAEEHRKLKFLYGASGIDTRYSVIADYSLPASEWAFYPPTENLEPFPDLEKRMAWYQRHAPGLAVDAIRACVGEDTGQITHLLTVSCTGMSAPGLDLQVMDLLGLPSTLFRSSINFMGCYAAIHGLKWADAICASDPGARVLVVCVELCTLHFQRGSSIDNMSSGLLFADGAAAVLVVPDAAPGPGVRLEHFHAEVAPQGKSDMAWELSSSGFRMTLSSYIPDLLEADFRRLVQGALDKAGLKPDDIRNWCIHPGGRRILEAVSRSLGLESSRLGASYDVLRSYGNMSSPTILFVLREILQRERDGHIFGAAFGPGLTMETFVAKMV